MKPWGPIEWLLPKIKVRDWHVITSSSFEDRCVALVEWMSGKNAVISTAVLVRITNPSTEFWTDGAPLVEKNFALLQKNLETIRHQTVDAALLDQPGSRMQPAVLNPESHQSVILDITTLPKRFFLFALKQLLNSPAIKNLVVTYARALEYPEAALCEDALPPAAFQAFGRVSSISEKPRMVVGVGYMPLSVEDLVAQAKLAKLDFIFPFPPASPAFRRNWDLLAMLMPQDFPHNTEIHRVHGMDAFEVYERVRAWGSTRALDLVPLGPKPHALGMALAHMRLDGNAEIMYSQPQSYNPNYSKGIARGEHGEPHIYAYCLKKDGRQLF
jgi:hypothetical protein